MRYDVRLRLRYVYQHTVADSRQLVRVVPRSLPGIQQVRETLLRMTPMPTERSSFDDFFGNQVVSVALRDPHQELDLEMRALVDVERGPEGPDLSPVLEGLQAALRGQRSLAADAPCHYLPASRRVLLLSRITAYAARSRLHPDGSERSVLALAQHLNQRLREDFAYDPEATEVDTPLAEAFDMRRGVCQDFSHIMIAGLRGLGIPAGYVSGFLRTIPPEGQPRLEGADATHAWVRVWCGEQMGWQELDPTNAIRAGNDHIVIGHGRDYSDVTPILGVLKTSGAHEASQAVDVIALDA